jgi:hypothetical protein
MLRFLGYQVGETQPTPKHIRHCILEYIAECNLPPLHDYGYFSQWGEPLTAARFRKLTNTLFGLNQSAELRKDVSYAKCIRDRNEDLRFVLEKYDLRHFYFEGSELLSQ